MLGRALSEQQLRRLHPNQYAPAPNGNLDKHVRSPHQNSHRYPNEHTGSPDKNLNRYPDEHADTTDSDTNRHADEYLRSSQQHADGHPNQHPGSPNEDADDTPTNTSVPPTFTITFGLINGSCSPFVAMGGFAPSTTYQFNLDYRVIATGQTGVLFQSMVTTNSGGNATFSHQVDGAEGTVQVRARMNGFSSDFVTIDC